MATDDRAILDRPTELRERATVLQAAQSLAVQGYREVTAGELSVASRNGGGEPPVPDWRVGQLVPVLGLGRAKNKIIFSLPAIEAAKEALQEDIEAVHGLLAQAVEYYQPLIEATGRAEQRAAYCRGLGQRRKVAEAFSKQYHAAEMLRYPLQALERSVEEMKAAECQRAQLQKVLEERPAVMAKLEEDVERLALSNQVLEEREEQKRQCAEERATFDQQKSAVIGRLASLRRVQHLMRNVGNNWTQLEADYQTSRAEFAEVWGIAEKIRAKRARGSWWSRLGRLGRRRRS